MNKISFFPKVTYTEKFVLIAKVIFNMLRDVAFIYYLRNN